MGECDFDLIVVGGGHAGVEASAAISKLGLSVLLLTLNKRMIANMPCNPHIGGSAKGVVVREIDALGGVMGKAADHHPLQSKMLNTSKGPSVQCLRTQQDKRGYPEYVQSLLEKMPNLTIKEGEAVDLLADGNRIHGVVLSSGERITSKGVILTTGTYMESRIISGRDVHPGGPDGEKSSHGLSSALEKLGITIKRFKTGTPPRLDKKTIDFSKAEIQLGSDLHFGFSYETKDFVPLKDQLPCYLIYTNERTHQIIKDHFEDSAVLNGTIKGIGPRYCPSIESKIVRFADKERHQLFLEPELENGDSIYLQGFSTGMPLEVQEEMVHSLPGLEKAKLLKYAYQIEYDAVATPQFDATLKIKKCEGLYVAGQICGTSGYEEAAGLGLIAGINAARHVLGLPPFILKRNEAYIGVMIDDLVTKGTDEPYRLLSSRAEYRLLLRHDNADSRLTPYGHELGLISDERYEAFLAKYERIDEAIKALSENNITNKQGLNAYLKEMGDEETNEGHKGLEILKRPRYSYRRIASLMDAMKGFDFDDESVLALETKVRYSGYIKKEEKEVEDFMKVEAMPIPEDFDFLHCEGLRLEARQKLDAVRPSNIGQASRIPGVNPADLSLLLLILKKERRL